MPSIVAFSWNGGRYAISEKRILFGALSLGLFFQAKEAFPQISFKPGFAVRLPSESHPFIKRAYRVVESWRDCFGNEAEWKEFRSNLCDQYCEHFILDIASEQNIYRRAWRSDLVLAPDYWCAILELAKSYHSFRITPTIAAEQEAFGRSN